MPIPAFAKAALATLLGVATLQAHAESKPLGKDTSQQIAAGIEMEMTAIMAGMVETCKTTFPARAAEWDKAWTDGLKTAPPQIQAYTQTAEFATKRQQYHEDQRAEAAKSGKPKATEDACNGLLR